MGYMGGEAECPYLRLGCSKPDAWRVIFCPLQAIYIVPQEISRVN